MCGQVVIADFKTRIALFLRTIWPALLNRVLLLRARAQVRALRAIPAEGTAKQEQAS